MPPSGSSCRQGTAGLAAGLVIAGFIVYATGYYTRVNHASSSPASWSSLKSGARPLRASWGIDRITDDGTGGGGGGGGGEGDVMLETGSLRTPFHPKAGAKGFSPSLPGLFPKSVGGGGGNGGNGGGVVSGYGAQGGGHVGVGGGAAASAGTFTLELRTKKVTIAKNSGVLDLRNRLGVVDAGFHCSAFDLDSLILQVRVLLAYTRGCVCTVERVKWEARGAGGARGGRGGGRDGAPLSLYTAFSTPP